jgi:PAS domain S-box-containing protein
MSPAGGPGAVLEPSLELLDRAFDAVPDLMLVLDREHRIVKANRAMAERVGASPAELVGQLCFRVMHGTDAPPSCCPHALAMRDGRAHATDLYEERLRAHFEVSVCPLLDDGGAPIGSVHVAHDITSRKEMAEDLEREEGLVSTILALHEAADRLGFDELSSFALEEMVRLTRSAVGYLFLYDEATERLTLHAWSREALHQCGVAERPTEYELAKTGLWGESVRQRRAIITNDYAAENPLKRGLPEGHAPIRRHLGLPIMIEGRIVAVAGVANKAEPYGFEDEKQLGLIGRGLWEIVQRKRREEQILDHQRSLRWLHRRLAATEEEERRRLAGEIHDTIAQDLAAARMRLAAHYETEKGTERAGELRELLGDLEEIIRASRALAYELSSPFLEQFGIAAALQWLCEDLGRRHGLVVECRCDEVSTDFPADRAVLTHRIAQELLRNVIKHSGARRALLRLRREGDGLRLEVEDGGRGFSAPGPRSGETEEGGFGLFSIRERLRDVGGTIQVRTAPGEGTSVAVTIPRARAPEAPAP